MNTSNSPDTDTIETDDQNIIDEVDGIPAPPSRSPAPEDYRDDDEIQATPPVPLFSSSTGVSGQNNISNAIRAEIAFAKSGKTLGEVWARRLDLPGGGCLAPLSRIHLDDAGLIEKLARWRKGAAYAYPTRFPVTEDGTRKWAESVVNADDRLLFLIYDAAGRVVGHAGYANALHDNNTLELDNILRGEAFAPQGIMSEAVLKLADWAHDSLLAAGVDLRVLASNEHAVRFYERLGFHEIDREPLKWEEDGQTKRLINCNTDEADDHFIQMVPKLPDTPKDMILTAGPSIAMREPVYVDDATRTGWNANWAKYLTQFETEFAQYIGARHALATSSCTGAMHIALMALGIGEGDEVIVPDITWVSTAQVVQLVGATPVFADVDRDTWCIDVASAENLITDKTRAIMPVHLYGCPADMQAIIKLAEAHDLYVIEDAAPSIGATIGDRKTGSFGHFAAFSFQGAKLAVTGEGGMLIARDQDLYQKAKQIWDQGRKPGTFDIQVPGVKYKMSNIQAALGLGQLQRNDAMVAAKQRIYGWYQDGLANLVGAKLQPQPTYGNGICWMTNLWLDEGLDISRDDLMAKLKDRKIDTRPVFPPISQYPIWGRDSDAQPMAQAVSNRAINLPSGVCLRNWQVDYVCQQIKDILDNT